MSVNSLKDATIVPESLAEQLRQLELSAGWPHDVITELSRIAQATVVPAGGVIFREGSPTGSIHIVADGQVALEMNVPARGSVRLLTVSRGELLGWSGALGGGVATATATAVVPTRLVTLPGSDLRSLCSKKPEIGFQVMNRVAWALARRLMATRLQLLDLYSHDAPVIKPSAGETA